MKVTEEEWRRVSGMPERELPPFDSKIASDIRTLHVDLLIGATFQCENARNAVGLLEHGDWIGLHAIATAYRNLLNLTGEDWGLRLLKAQGKHQNLQQSRHADRAKAVAAVHAEWQANGSKWSSKASAAREMCRNVALGYTPIVVERWIRADEKQKK